MKKIATHLETKEWEGNMIPRLHKMTVVVHRHCAMTKRNFLRDYLRALMVSEKAPKGARGVITIETQGAYQSVLLKRDGIETWQDLAVVKIDLCFRCQVTEQQGNEIVAFLQKNGAAVIYWR